MTTPQPQPQPPSPYPAAAPPPPPSQYTPPLPPPEPPYPAAFSADYGDGRRNRLTSFFRLLLAIPAAVFAAIYGLGVTIAVFVAWFALLVTGQPREYPIRTDYAPPQKSYSRVRVLFRGVLVIPWAIVGWAYGVGLNVLVFLAWFAILFTGRFPAVWFDFAVRVQRWQTQFSAFAYLLTDRWPPFELR